MWFPTRPVTNRPVQAQERARSLKFRIYEEGELYYPSGENKGADHLRSYCEADLRICFRLCRLLVFPCGGSNVAKIRIRRSLARYGSGPPRGNFADHNFHIAWCLRSFLKHVIPL